MQLGVVHNKSAEKARKAGINVLMNKCIMIEHKNVWCVKKHFFSSRSGGDFVLCVKGKGASSCGGLPFWADLPVGRQGLAPGG